MKRIAPCILFLFLSGCAAMQTPAAQWAAARETLTVTQNTMLTLHDTGVVDDDDLLELDPYVKAARAAIEEAEKHIEADDAAFHRYLDIAMRALATLEREHNKRLEGQP